MCPLRCSFLLAGNDTPSEAYEAQSGEEVLITFPQYSLVFLLIVTTPPLDHIPPT